MEEKLELLLLKLLAESPIFLAKIFSLKEVADSLALPTNCIARTPVRNFATRGARRIFSVKISKFKARCNRNKDAEQDSVWNSIQLIQIAKV